MTVLGAGTMGVSILQGLLVSLSESGEQFQESCNALPLFDRLPTRFIACVNRVESMDRVRSKLAKYSDHVDVWQGRNDEAVQAADIVLLSCKPQHAKRILTGGSMPLALSGKLMLNVCVGFSTEMIDDAISASGMTVRPPCYVVDAVPNTASMIRQSTTIVCEPRIPLPPHLAQLPAMIFGCIGTVIYQPIHLMDSASIVSAATPAFFALVLEGVIEGAIRQGIDARQARAMAASAMKGAAEMVLDGQDPAEVRQEITTPQGCTARGLEVLANGQVKQTFADAVEQATNRVAELKRKRTQDVQ